MQKRIKCNRLGMGPGVPQEMDAAPLPDGFRNNLPDRPLQAGTIVRHNLDDAAQAAIPQRLQEPTPARTALALRKLDAENLPAARRVDTDRNQNRPVADNAVLADLLVAGVQNQIRKRTLQTPLRELPELRIQLRIEPADRRRRKTVAAKRLRRLRDLPGRNPVNLHLHQCGDIRDSEARRAPLRTLAALEQLGAGRLVPILGNAKLNPADPRRQMTLAAAGTAARTVGRPLVLRGARRLRHLFLKNLLKRAPQKLANRIAPGPELRLELGQLRSAMHPGHGVVLSCSRDG